MTDQVVVLSGGMDSAAALSWAIARTPAGTEPPVAVSFDYGQRHLVELQHADAIAHELQVPHQTLTVPLGAVGGSSLTDPAIDVPDGHYSAAGMSATVVPNRNMIFTAIATAVAIAHGATKVVLGVHAGDHPIYADCRPEFVAAMNTAVEVASEGQVNVVAPWLDVTKAEIVQRGAAMGTPFELTWSCYKGEGAAHCGRCGTCVERAEAFHLAGIPDPTVYEDPHYWRTVTQ